MKAWLQKIFPLRAWTGKRAARAHRITAGSMTLSFDGRIVRLYLPEA